MCSWEMGVRLGLGAPPAGRCVSLLNPRSPRSCRAPRPPPRASVSLLGPLTSSYDGFPHLPAFKGPVWSVTRCPRCWVIGALRCPWEPGVPQPRRWTGLHAPRPLPAQLRFGAQATPGGRGRRCHQDLGPRSRGSRELSHIRTKSQSPVTVSASGSPAAAVTVLRPQLPWGWQRVQRSPTCDRSSLSPRAGSPRAPPVPQRVPQPAQSPHLWISSRAGRHRARLSSWNRSPCVPRPRSPRRPANGSREPPVSPQGLPGGARCPDAVARTWPRGGSGPGPPCRRCVLPSQSGRAGAWRHEATS